MTGYFTTSLNGPTTVTDTAAPLFLGIDGGGTRCRARICDADGHRLGEGIAGSANTRLGLDKVFAEIKHACQQALSAAGLADNTLGQLHAGLGLAGLALKSEQQKLQQFQHPFKSMVANTDAYIACLGAHAGDDGAVLILGTGSCGCGIVDSQIFNLGGWGFQLTDQGSGAQLGLTAIRHALWAFEGMQPTTALSQAIMAKFDHDPEQAVLWADQARPADYAALAPLVFEHATQNDVLAQSLLAQTASAAADLIRTLIKRGAPTITLLGGLSALLTPYLPDHVRTVLAPAAGDALDGALLMARRHFYSEESSHDNS